MKTEEWLIFTELGSKAKPYILDSTNLDISEEEIARNIEEQIYKEKKWKLRNYQ